MTRSLPLALLALFLAMPAALAAQPARDTEGEAEMLARINALRSEAALPPLVRHAALDEAALVHSMDMAEHAMLAHLSPRTGDPATRVADTGIHATRIAQNIALRRSTSDALASILESDAHRAQLLTPELTHVGLAAVRGARGIYVTQVVAELEGPAPLPPPALHDLRPRPAEGHGAGANAEAGSDPSADPEADAVDEADAAAAAMAEAEAAIAAAAAARGAGAEEPDRCPARSAEVAPAAPAPVEAPMDPRERALAAAPAPGVDAAGRDVVEAPEVSTAPEVAEERVYREAYEAPAAHAEAEPSARGEAHATAAPTIRLPYGTRPGVAGYWVFYGSRWWFFPIDGREPPGSVLHADPSVQGPPAGYDDAGRPTSPAVAPRVAPPLPPRPAFGWSPRRHYPLWRQSF